MLVVGDREVEQRSVTVRSRGSKETEPLPLAEAVAQDRPAMQPAGRSPLRLSSGRKFGYTADLHKEEATLPT